MAQYLSSIPTALDLLSCTASLGATELTLRVDSLFLAPPSMALAMGTAQCSPSTLMELVLPRCTALRT